MILVRSAEWTEDSGPAFVPSGLKPRASSLQPNGCGLIPGGVGYTTPQSLAGQLLGKPKCRLRLRIRGAMNLRSAATPAGGGRNGGAQWFCDGMSPEGSLMFSGPYPLVSPPSTGTPARHRWRRVAGFGFCRETKQQNRIGGEPQNHRKR